MRNNPKLLMQMIPDAIKSPEEAAREGKMKQDIVLKRSKVYDKIEEAQQWQKLQRLANNFMTKRQQAAAQSMNLSRKPPRMDDYVLP